MAQDGRLMGRRRVRGRVRKITLELSEDVAEALEGVARDGRTTRTAIIEGVLRADPRVAALLARREGGEHGDGG